MRVVANGQTQAPATQVEPNQEIQLTPYEAWLADRIDPTRLVEAHECTGVPGARAPHLEIQTRPLPAIEVEMVNQLLTHLSFVSEPGEQVQVSYWIKQYLAGDPRHDSVIHWHLPYMDLHTHVHGVLSTSAFLGNVKVAIQGVESAFWEDFANRYAKFLDSLKTPLRGNGFDYGFNDRYRSHAAGGMPDLNADSDLNFAQLAKALELIGPGKEHSCSISYAHAYDLRGMVRDAVETVSADKGARLSAKCMEDIAESLKKQRVGSVDMQVSMSFLERPEALQLLKACNVRGIHVNYLPYELSVKRLHKGELNEADETRLRGVFKNPLCSGIDYCGAEFPFTPEGMTVFRRTLQIMRELANETGRVLVMRPHVGEGFKDDEGRVTPKEVGRRNVEMLLSTIEEFYRENGHDPLVEIRFGHATHSTADHCARMKELGIVVEGNPLSNETTGVATRDEHGILNWVTYAVQHLFGTDGAGVMLGDMQQVEELEEAVLWAFRNGFAKKETSLCEHDHQKGRLAFQDLVQQRAAEILFARIKQTKEKTKDAVPSPDDLAQAERQLWNIFSMERVKGLAELRRLDIGWKMRKTGEIPVPQKRGSQLFTALMSAARGDFVPLNHFLKCVYFFRGRTPFLPKPTGMASAFTPKTSLKRRMPLHQALAHEVVKAAPAQATALTPSVNDVGIAKLREALVAACEDIKRLRAPTLEQLQVKAGEKTVSLEDAFVAATSGVSLFFETTFGKRMEVGTGRRAAIEGWTLVLDEKRNVVGIQLMANTAKDGSLSHYTHLGAGGAPIKIGDTLTSYFTRTQPEVLTQRAGASGLMTGPTGKPIVFAGPVDLNDDDRRLGLFAAFATQTSEAAVGGKFASVGQEHRVLVRNEKGQIESRVQERQMPKKWTTITLDALEQYLNEKIKNDQVVGHTSDLIYLMKQIKALTQPGKPVSMDALARRLQQGALVSDPVRDAGRPANRPIERVSQSGVKTLEEFFSQIVSVFEQRLKPLSQEGMTNWRLVRDYLDKGAGEFKGMAALLEKMLEIPINIGDSPFVRIQFRNQEPIWVPMGRTIMSLAPKGYADKAWHLESLSPDATGHGVLLRYWDTANMAA